MQQFATENRLRFRRALAHAVDTCIEAGGRDDTYKANVADAVHELHATLISRATRAHYT